MHIELDQQAYILCSSCSSRQVGNPELFPAILLYNDHSQEKTTGIIIIINSRGSAISTETEQCVKRNEVLYREEMNGQC